jgi:entericidin B
MRRRGRKTTPFSFHVRYRTDCGACIDYSRLSQFNFPQRDPTEKTMKTLIAMMVGMSFLLGACNTMEGAGKDVKAAGGKVEKEAREDKKY